MVWEAGFLAPVLDICGLMYCLPPPERPFACNAIVWYYVYGLYISRCVDIGRAKITHYYLRVWMYCRERVWKWLYFRIYILHDVLGKLMHFACRHSGLWVAYRLSVQSIVCSGLPLVFVIFRVVRKWVSGSRKGCHIPTSVNMRRFWLPRNVNILTNADNPCHGDQWKQWNNAHVTTRMYNHLVALSTSCELKLIVRHCLRNVG